ncbi:transcriptional regulator [Mycolicibacterium mucogenicum DSM 44124]|uniref:TetR/AcrR family transcriptional regulator n=1 Tax=Mycolicibacterium mucogenicum DSM 44124 TaxID=1226753 RepID=A0A8H2JDK5_MYCMU|nr:transcriptional regulator [Mycolicibacterium mucogenicum DSM 44124]QPG72289.1 TetR/AcrR family transcriptional regulator [Mycolicibacterium mucogenicum DSM 44124]
MDGRTLRYQHRRPELLAAATEYVLDNGISDLSLRDMARALGITHATLLRHFVSKEDLLLQVIAKIRADFVDQLSGDDQMHPDRTASRLLRTTWKRLCDPAEQRQFVLLFEVVGRATREGGRVAELAQASIHDWLNIIAAQLVRTGCSPKEADTLATLVLAQVRGLQVDLLLTGDRRRVDRAIEALIEMIDRRSE